MRRRRIETTEGRVTGPTVALVDRRQSLRTGTVLAGVLALPIFTADAGRIVRSSGPDSMEEVAFGLDTPVAAGIGPGGAMDVARPAFGSSDGTGSVIRIDLAARSSAAGNVFATPGA